VAREVDNRVNQGASVKLNPDELAIVRLIEKRYNETSKKPHVYGSEVRENALRDGIGGEIAFCKLHNIYYDPFGAGRPYDVVWWDYKLDIKTSRKNTLWVPEYCVREGVDGYVLMQTDDGETFRYLGKISLAKLQKFHKMKNTQYGKAYGIMNYNLSP
jgi:hypothetical protein